MKKGLGRSFDSLIPTNLIDESFDPTAKQDGKVSQLKQLPIEQVMADPDQPRRMFDEEALDELSESIKIHGILQPLVVTGKAGAYVIVAGERRWRAAQRAGLTEVPALVRTLSGQHRLELSLIENLQRRDLNPLETATAYAKLRDQFNLTLDEIGKRVGGKSVSAISNTMRLLKLPKAVQEAVFSYKITEGQARPLINVPKEVAEELLEKIITEGWSARRIEQAIVLWKESKKNPFEKRRPVEIPHEEVVQNLTKKLNSKIKIRTNTRGAGQIIIPFTNAVDFERIHQLLKK